MRWTSIPATFRFTLTLALGLVLAAFQGQAQAVPAGQGLVADSTELRVLRQFYQATDGAQWTTHTNWPATAAAWDTVTVAGAASWYGLWVDNHDILGLNLTGNHLRGQLPTRLGSLGQLRNLIVGSNELDGPLPTSFADLTWLNCCDLTHNQFSGELTGLFNQQHNLQVLALDYNQFTGSVPGELGRLTRLYIFSANNNQLSGPLPAALGNSQTLWGIFLTDNQLTGPIPGRWGRLHGLGQLFLDRNQLSGPLPDSLAQIPSLSYLSASGNQLSGLLPAAYAAFRYMAQLNLSHNQLSGTIPPGPQTGQLLLDNNHFSGALPASYATTRNWQIILDNNELTGLPTFVRPQGRLTVQLGLTYNYLEFDAYESNQTQCGQYQHWDYGQRTRPGDTTLVVAGQPVTLNGTIGGMHNHYQWQRLVGGQWVDLPGDTLATRDYAQVQPADAGAYRTRVWNDCVRFSLTSPVRTLDVVPYAPLARNLPDDSNQGTGEDLAAALGLMEDTSPTGDVNYVRTWVPRVALTQAGRVSQAPVDSVAASTSYLDGLGRPLQTVQHQASPQKWDVVQPHHYDALDREPYQFLPYAAAPTSQRQGYHAGALAAQDSFYRRTTPVGGGAGPLAPDDPIQGIVRTGVAYAQTQFEASPLGRVTAQAAPGEMWRLSGGHVVERHERPNTAQDSVPRFAPGYNLLSRDPGYQGYYAPGELWATVVADAHGPNEPGAQGYRTIEWKDKLGQVVCRQVESGRTGSMSQGLHSRWLRTAYAYDELGHLRYVLQPEAVKRVLALGNTVAMLPTACQPFLFHYRYDGRGRQIAKQVPGQAGETVVVYDQLDRPILSQDAAQRLRHEWSWSKYDALGRLVLTGLTLRAATDTASAVTLQAWVEADTATSHQYEQRTADLSNYPQGYTTVNAFPRIGQQGFVSGQVLTATRYDDYDFNNDGQPDVAYDTSHDAQFASGAAPVADAARTTGLVTRTLTRVLGVTGDADHAAWLVTTTFYDERARPVQVQNTNARNGQDLVTTQLDFAGQVRQSVTTHRGPNHAPVLVREFLTYDHAGRVLTSRQQLADEVRAVRLDSVQYNALGQVVRKTLGMGRLKQEVDYAYNARGWLTSLNDPYRPDAADLFSLSLHYERGFTRGYEQYNGNLTGQTWRGRDGVQRAYGYVYDPLNRLLQGDFVAREGGTNSIDVSAVWNRELDHYRLNFVSYDDNGNILTLRRQGLLQAATHVRAKQYGLVDNLSYVYAGNRLQTVTDQVSGNRLAQPASYHGAPTSLAGDFQQASNPQPGAAYLYDANGNLTQDRNKNLTGISYNHLNLPRQLHFGQVGDSVVFRYTAAGQKVAKLVYQTGKLTPQRTDYLGPFQYEGDSLRFFPHVDGRVLRFVSKDPAGQAHVSYQREFTIKDHLGNLRLAYRLGQRRTFLATLEQDSTTRKRETQQFDSLSVSLPVAQLTSLNHSGNYAARLNAGGSTPQPLGPLTQLAVQQGDTVTVTAYGLYQQPVQHNFLFALASWLTSILHPTQTPPAGMDGRNRRNLPLLQVGVAAGLTSLPHLSGGVPQGYLRLLVFNRDSALVGQYVQQLTQAAQNNFQLLSLQVIVPQDGYVSAYVGNGSDVDVFFDDMRVEYRSGVEVQENQYDPWGMNLVGIEFSSPGIRGLNSYQFNSKERQLELGLNWSDYGARLFDECLGRFNRVDPMSGFDSSFSPYAYAGNDPINNIDVDGNFRLSAAMQQKYPYLAYLLKNVASNIANNSFALKTISSYTGYSTNQIIKYATWGQGPEVVVDDMGFTASASDDIEGVAFGFHVNRIGQPINIRTSLILKLESYAKKDYVQNKANLSYKQLFEFMTLVTVFHEFIHYGRTQHNLSELLTTPNQDNEAGNNWETATFGFRAWPNNIQSEVLGRRNDFNQALGVGSRSTIPWQGFMQNDFYYNRSATQAPEQKPEKKHHKNPRFRS